MSGPPQASAPDATECPYRSECIKDEPPHIGMHHCPICGTMVLKGLDPTPFCMNLQENSPNEDPQQ